MENQVTSIKQSKRLIEMGVPAEKASMVWIALLDGFGNYCLETKDGYCCPDNRDIPAFTVADLLGMMPKNIPAAGSQNHDYCLTLSHGFCWKICYEDNRTHRRIGEEADFDLVDILCNRIEWLLSNGYKLEV